MYHPNAARRRIARDYAEADDRRCHQCSKVRTVEELSQALIANDAVVQAWSGRVFCFPHCWDEYKEGL